MMADTIKNQQNRNGSAPSGAEPKPQLDEDADGLRGRDKAGGDLRNETAEPSPPEGQVRERKGPYGKTTGRN